METVFHVTLLTNQRSLFPAKIAECLLAMIDAYFWHCMLKTISNIIPSGRKLKIRKVDHNFVPHRALTFYQSEPPNSQNASNTVLTISI